MSNDVIEFLPIIALFITAAGIVGVNARIQSRAAVLVEVLSKRAEKLSETMEASTVLIAQAIAKTSANQRSIERLESGQRELVEMVREIRDRVIAAEARGGG